MFVRKTVSLTLLFSFVLLLVTSLVLYVVPEGRVAYWSDWRWLALSKTQWGNLHTTLGFLFLAAGLLHLGYNWQPVTAYLKSRARQLRLFTPAGTTALALNLLFLAGTLLGLPPCSSILDLGRHFKDRAAAEYGEPPYGHAELSPLAQFARRTGLDLDTVTANLTRAGIRFTGHDQPIVEIARANGLTPKAVHEAMGAPSAAAVHTPSQPDDPPPGLGRMTLADLCRRYGLDQQQVIAALAGADIRATPEQTLREIAAAHQTNPHVLFDRIRAVARP